jgi:DNA polymerase-1
MPDPIGTMAGLEEDADSDATSLRGLIAGWEEIDTDRQGLTVANAIKILDNSAANEFDTLKSVLAEMYGTKEKRSEHSQKLSARLRSWKRRTVAGKCFDTRPGGHAGAKVWYVRDVEPRPTAPRPNVPDGDDGDDVPASEIFSLPPSYDPKSSEKIPVEESSSPSSPSSPSSGALPCGTTWQLVSHPADIPTVLVAIDESERIGLDTETTGLSPHNDRVRLLQLATDRGIFLIDLFAVPDVSALWEPLAGVELVIHNSAFDLQFLHRLGFTAGKVFDTMIASRLLTAGTKQGNGLADVAKRVLDIDLDKEQQKSNWGGTLTPEMIQYAARDSHITRRLYDPLTTAIREAKLETVADIEMRAVPSFVWMACAGSPFDSEAWAAVAAEAEEYDRTLVENLDLNAPPRDGCINGDGAWNWNSPADIMAMFKQIGIDLKDTSDATLAGVPHQIAIKLRERRSAAQLAKTFGKKWPKEVHDGRLFATWNQLGTDAGRSSCKGPNLQQVPRDPRYRNCFRAPEGRVLIKADYSQLQLRIACKVAKEKVMLAAYKKGDDLHMLTAIAITGKKEPSKADRKTAKAVNFGLLFGMGPERLMDYAKAEYGLELSLEQAKQYREKFFATYPSLRKWHKEKGGSTSPETRTLLGRRRLFDDGNHYSDRLNSPVQGSEADGAKQAMSLLWERRADCPHAFPVMFIHDEIVIEADADQADAAAQWLRSAMIDGMTPVLGKVPCEVETQITTTWGGE